MVESEALTADIVVVGAGVLGTFHAWFAAQRDRDVLLLERNTLPNDASTRNFGMMPQTIARTQGEWADFAWHSASIYRAIQAERDIGVRQIGSLYLALTAAERSVLREFADRFGAGYRCTFIEPEDARREYPFISTNCSGALLFPDDLGADPRTLLSRLIPFVTESGRVTYRPQTTVISVQRSGDGCVVRAADGLRVTADRVIICSGAEYRTLFPEHLGGSGLRVCKLQMMRTRPMTPTLPHSILTGLSIRRYPAFEDCSTHRELAEESLDGNLSTFGIHVLLKQETDGTVVIGDSHEYRRPGDAAAGEERSSPAVDGLILDYARATVNLPDWSIESTWNGYYMMHPDLQVYTADLDDRIHLVTGIGGKGMTTGPGFAYHSMAAILHGSARMPAR